MMTNFTSHALPEGARRSLPLSLILAALLCLDGTALRPFRPLHAQGPTPALPAFTDVTQAARIAFRHESGAFGKKYLPETIGAGGAFLDADGDGWQDIFLVNSTTWPGQPASRSRSALYRNNHDGTFTDVTAASGLGAAAYGMGVAAADYDNDGKTDIYLTALGRNRLFRN